MTKNHVANGLVNALLSGDAQTEPARARCIQTLGTDYPWLGKLVRRLVNQFVAAWHTGSSEQMSTTITSYPDFCDAFSGRNRPRLRYYFLASPNMIPRPLGLRDCDIPKLPAPGDIADWLDITTRDLDWFCQPHFRRSQRCNDRSNHYVYQWIPKRNGGFRLIESPKIRLKTIQRRILGDILNRVPTHESVHGFRRGYSPLSNAAVHVGQRVVIHMDLEDFFLNVGRARVTALFKTLGYPVESARTFSALCTNLVPYDVLNINNPAKYDHEIPKPSWRKRQQFQSPHLPQGAPTSPALANLCAFRLDMRLAHAARTIGARYTRYADDLVFSGGRTLSRGADRFPSLVGAIALEEGFAINHRKTRVMRTSSRQQVTGIVVNEKPNLSRSQYDALKATLYNCSRQGAVSQNRHTHSDYRAYLAGRIAYFVQVNPGRGTKLRKLFDRICWDNE